MQKIFLVKNGDLKEVNEQLKKGGSVKMIQAVPEIVSSYGYHAFSDGYFHKDCDENHGKYTGDIYAYVVIEFE